MLPLNEIICGAMPEAIKGWPAESINCCISSPPYWSLRDYSACDCSVRRQYSEAMRTHGGANRTDGVGGQIDYNDPRCKKEPDPNCPKCKGTGFDQNVKENQLGLEKTFEEYIDKLCTIYDEVKRVLRKDGTCWVNLGDTYGSGKGYEGLYNKYKQDIRNKPPVKGFEKSLLLIPQRFAIEMVNRGWILRNVIIWHKPNPMPSSAKDRFTVDFEYVYFFVKSKRYWFEPQYEPYLTESNAERPRMGQGNQTKYNQKRNRHKESTNEGYPFGDRFSEGERSFYENPLGRNKRCVWTIPTQAYSEAHFATFPEKLVEPMIKAGCPEFVCTKCGKAREKVWERVKGHDWNAHKTDEEKMTMGCGAGASADKERINTPPKFKGYTDCGCGEDWRPGVMLDPFAVRAQLARLLPN